MLCCLGVEVEGVNAGVDGEEEMWDIPEEEAELSEGVDGEGVL